MMCPVQFRFQAFQSSKELFDLLLDGIVAYCAMTRGP